MKKLLFTILIGLFVLSSGSAFASQLLFDRGLPTVNLNNAAGADRSNVAWGFNANDSGRYLAGDDFSIAGSGDYSVDTLRIWTVTSNTSLWLGEEGGAFSQYSPSSTSNIAYADGTSYQGSGDGFTDLYQLDFSLNSYLKAATTYQFYLDGPVPSFIHASNAALSGSPQEGADDLFRYAFAPNSGGPPTNFGTLDSDVPGFWDKSSDVNIQIYGTPVPEPSTFLLLGSGLAGLGFYARKRKKA